MVNDAIKEVRATLAQVREMARGDLLAHNSSLEADALNRLANAIDVLTGEVEALASWRPMVNNSLIALKDFCQAVTKKFHTG